MANVSILSGDITVYFDNDPSGYKQITWTGSAATSATRTVNEVYTAVMDLFDNVTGGAGDYVQYGIPMRAVTPRVYQIGQIDNTDPAPWFSDETTLQHLTGGSIESTGWVQTSTSAGILQLNLLADTAATAADIGKAVVGTTSGDSGTLVGIIDGENVSTIDIFVAPDTTADDFVGDSAVTIGGGGSQNFSSITNAEQLWVNIATVGTIVDNSNIYIRKDTNDVVDSYWPAGPVDRLFQFDDGEIVTVYARKPTTLYDFFTLSVTSGQNIAPLATSLDINDTTGNFPQNGINVNFAGPYTVDVDPDLGSPNENYSIEIDCNNQPLANVYQYLKTLTDENSSVELVGTNPLALIGNEYLGVQFLANYTAQTGTVSISDKVTGVTSGATGRVLNKTATYVVLTDVEGTFGSGEILRVSPGNELTSISNLELIQANKQAPFGSIAGGRFFGARGVYLTNVLSTEINNYQLLTDQGEVAEEEIQVSFTISGLKDSTELRLYETGTTTQVAGVETMTGGVGTGTTTGVTVSGSTDDNTFSYVYVYSADISVFAQIHANTWVNLRIENLTLSSTNQSIPVSQQFDRNYSNP